MTTLQILGEMRNVELRQKYLATRGPALVRADLCFTRRRLVAIEVVRAAVGLALLAALGGIVGEWLLAGTVNASGRFAGAVKVGVGCAAVAAGMFAILGALGHVVFGDLVGDFRECRRKSTFRWAALLEIPVEFAGGAIWGTVCGTLIGCLMGLGCWLLDLTPVEPGELIAVGAAHAALLGAVLTVLGLLVRRLRQLEELGANFATLGPLPLLAYFFSRTAARQEYLPRRQRNRINPLAAPCVLPAKLDTSLQVSPGLVPPKICGSEE
jgi:hypothetical protein